jgi:hypothetical protein
LFRLVFLFFPFVESPAFSFIGSRGGRDVGDALEVKFVERYGIRCSDVLREWPAIPGHHGDVEDETVKRPRILWHAGLVPLLTGGWSRRGRGRVDEEWIRPSPENFGVRHSPYSASRGISGGTVSGMVYTVTSFHRPFQDGQ